MTTFLTTSSLNRPQAGALLSTGCALLSSLLRAERDTRVVSPDGTAE